MKKEKYAIGVLFSFYISQRFLSFDDAYTM